MSDGSVTIDTKLNNDGFKSGIGKIGNIAKSALTGMVASIGAVTVAFAGMVTASVKARGELEQSVGGAKKIFDEMDYSKIEKDAKEAYKTMNLSAKEYLDMINSVGATFASTMGDEKGYNTAKKGMQAIADYASGTGADINNLNEKYKMITRSTTSYLSIADQFSGILPQTTDDFLKQAQSAGFLSQEYKKLNDVPVAEYQQAISLMLEKGVADMGLLGNTVAETETTLTGSINALKASWENFLSGSGDLSQVVDSAEIAIENIIRIVEEAIPSIIDSIVGALPRLIELGGQILNKLIEGIINNLPQIITTTLTLIQTLVQAIITYAPQIWQGAVQIIQQLIIGIAQMLPTLIPQAVECIITIVMGLLDNIDMLVDAGIELIIGLAMGLIEALPILIEKIPIIIEKLIDAIVRNLPKLLEAGIKLIVMLGEGLIKAIPQLLSKIPQIIGALLNGLGGAIAGVVEVGKNIVQGLWQGIQNAWDWLINKVKGFAADILSGMMKALGIHSPSTLFRDKVGKNIALGVGEGFEDNISKVYSKMKSAVDFETQKLSAKLSTTAMFDKVININSSVRGNVELDGNKVGRLVTPVVSKTIKAGGLA